MDEFDRRDPDADVPTLQDLFRLIRRGLLPAALVAVASAVAAYFLSSAQDPRFEAEATVLMARSTGDLQTFGTSLVTAPALDPSAYRAAALANARLRTALLLTGTEAPTAEDVERLRRATEVRVEDDRNSGLIHFQVRADDPEGAAALANALAGELVSWDERRATENLQQIAASLESQIAALDQQIASLQAAGTATQDQIDGRAQLRAEQQEQLYYARTLSNSAVGLLDLLEPAVPPTDPVAPNPVRSAALAFVLGLFLVYGLLLLRDALDTRLRDSDDLSRVTGLPVLSEFPRMAGGGRRLPREGAGYLRTNLMFATTDAHPKVLLVTSPQQAEGKSSVALSLAESFARNDHRTLLVDADLRKPVIGGEYGLDPRATAPLRAWLDAAEAGGDDPRPATVTLGSGTILDVIPSFQAAPSPTELLSRGFLDALEGWRREYDVIVIDSAPVLPVADTLTIAPLCTGTVLVASADGTDRRRLAAAVALLQRIGVRVLGAVATNLPTASSTQNGYGYGYGYGYGAPEPSTPHSGTPGGEAPKRRPVGRT